MSLAASNVFLTVDRVCGENDAGKPKIADHLLRGGDLIGLVVDFGVRQDDGVIAGERRQSLRCLPVVDMVEAAAQRLAVECDHRPLAWGCSRQDGGSVVAECRFEVAPIQRLEHRPQRVDGRSPLQIDAEMPVEVVPALLQESDDPAIGPGTAQQRQHREHQQMRQRIPLALSPPWIWNLRQRGQKMGKWNHGTLLQGAPYDSHLFVQR